MVVPVRSEGLELLTREIKKEFDRLKFGFTERQIKDAIKYADEAESKFKAELYDEGDKFLSKVERNNEKVYVGIGRDYVLLDPEASSNSGSMFSQIRGLNYIPQVFLEHLLFSMPFVKKRDIQRKTRFAFFVLLFLYCFFGV